MCLAGASGAGVETLAAIPDVDLRAHYVWVPMLPTDDESAAMAASQRFADERATHYWDAERHLARRLAAALGIDTRPSAAPGDDPPFAWDVYLAYRRGNGEIERPDFWMHQLAVITHPGSSRTNGSGGLGRCWATARRRGEAPDAVRRRTALR